ASIVAKEINVGRKEGTGQTRIVGVRPAGNRRLSESSRLEVGLGDCGRPSSIWRHRRHRAVRIVRVAAGTERRQELWVGLIDWIQQRRQMERSIADVGNRKKHVVRQFTLEPNIPALGVRNFAWIPGKLP